MPGRMTSNRAGFSLEDLMAELGRLELQALARLLPCCQGEECQKSQACLMAALAS